MGNKSKKVGKGRKDKFYHLAKETGFRARSAFKLIQLNRKFGFLQESRVCLDLCAAPGGWLQVAVKHMPMSSIVIGVDLVAIKPIKGVTTFMSDITTDQCRQLVKKEIKNWKIDVVLNDGAPNVGSAWVQDAFTQAQLALSALKLACDFLRKGGWFITKVFRSKDYSALMWVFQQLFKKVHSTKPQASRNESAEIFVVCQGYLAPDKLDEKFLDPKHVFKEVSQTTNIKLNILHPEKTTRQREGYPENNPLLFTVVKASEFINTKDAVEVLSTVNKIEMDDPKITDHKFTTEEVKLCCEDIKLLGKREIKLLFTWRKKIRKDFRLEEDDAEEEKEEPMEEEAKELTEEEKEKQMDDMIAELNESEAKTLKNKRRKVRAERKKIREKLANKMSSAIETTDEMDMFTLKVLRNRQDLEAIELNSENQDTGEDLLESDQEEESEVDLGEGLEGDDGDDSDTYIYGDDDLYTRPSRKKKGEDDNEEDKAQELRKKKKKREKEKVSTANPLLEDLGETADDDVDDEEDLKTKEKATKAALWYQKGIFKDIEDEDDEEYDMKEIVEKASAAKKRKVTFNGATKDGIDDLDDDDDSDDDDEDDSDEDLSTDEEEEDDRSVAQTSAEPEKKKPAAASNTFEVVPQTEKGGYLNPHALALGTAMATSKKRKRDIIDDAYNRYAFGKEDALPSWFVEDETKHRYRHAPITKDEVEFYKSRQREINARPIKKVIEAQAKKKDKMLRKLEKVRKKADGVLEADDVSEREKASQLKGIYKRAGLIGKRKEKVTYVVAKKSQAGKNYKRPDGLKGQYKVVDPRMKKEMRAAKQKEKTKGRKGKKGKGR